MPKALAPSQITSADIKKALLTRHPAVGRSSGMMPVLDAWTVIEEWEGIDLLAFSAYRHPARGALGKKSDFPRVGYEVKVSRSDKRRELLAPWKRERARSICHEFYLAVPRGLLTKEELAFVQPDDWTVDDYVRKRCPAFCLEARNVMVGERHREMGLSGGEYVVRDAVTGWSVCSECGGKGHLGPSRVEKEAPTLWVPPDIGLVEAGKRCKIIRESPVFEAVELTSEQVSGLVRWVSVRPDARHQGVAERQREVARLVTLQRAEHKRQRREVIESIAAGKL